MTDRKMIALTASMDGERVLAQTHGKKVKVSEIELLALCNFAELGLYSVFAELDGEAGEDAAKAYESQVNSIRKHCGKDGKLDGLNRLSQTCSAILRGERLGKYILSETP